MSNNDDQERIILTYDFVEHETKDAYLLSFDDEPNVWIPKSLSILNSKDETIEIPLWLAIEKEIEIYEE